MDSTDSPSSVASLSAIMVDGTNTPFSTVLIVLRETPIREASSPWVKPARSRISRSLEINLGIAIGASFENSEPYNCCKQAD